MKKPTERLLDLFVPLMEQEGYAYRKSNHRFLKTFAHGQYEFNLIFDGRGGMVGVDAGFFVHFDALEKQFKKVLGYACPWSAGASLLNAGANPWKYWLFDERFANMTPQERADIPSDVIHPESRMQEGVQFLLGAHSELAQPLFRSLQTYRQLADFYGAYRRDSSAGRCRPLAENVVYLAMFVAAALGDDVEEIALSARGMQSGFTGHDVDAKVASVRQYIAANDLKTLLT